MLKLNIHNLNLYASENYKGIVCGYLVKFNNIDLKSVKDNLIFVAIVLV